MYQDAPRVLCVLIRSDERLACYYITHPFFLGFISRGFLQYEF